MVTKIKVSDGEKYIIACQNDSEFHTVRNKLLKLWVRFEVLDVKDYRLLEINAKDWLQD